MTFGKRIKEQRNNHDWTQAYVAEKLFLTRQAVSNWEKGKTYPDLNTLVKISDLFQISVDSLLKEDKELKNYLEQGKAYDAFSIFRGLFFIMFGLFFLITNYVDTRSPVIIEYSIYAFLVIFGIAILYGEHVKPFFLGISKAQYKARSKKAYQDLSLVGKLFLLIIVILEITLFITRGSDIQNYIATLLFITVGIMNIFHAHMKKRS